LLSRLPSCDETAVVDFVLQTATLTFPANITVWLRPLHNAVAKPFSFSFPDPNHWLTSGSASHQAPLLAFAVLVSAVITDHLITDHLITAGLITAGLITDHLITDHLITDHLITDHLITAGLITNTRGVHPCKVRLTLSVKRKTASARQASLWVDWGLPGSKFSSSVFGDLALPASRRL